MVINIRSCLTSFKPLIFIVPSNIQAKPFEISLKKQKLFSVCINKPPSQNSQYFHLAMVTVQTII